MGRSVRKLITSGDVSGSVSVARQPGRERVAALAGILDLAETHPQRVREARDQILEVSLGSVNEPDPALRAMSINFLTLFRDQAAPTIVVGALADPAPQVRVAALLAVFHLRPPACHDDVLRLLDDDDVNVRASAAAALERVGDRSSVRALTEARSREQDEWVRRRIDEVVDILDGRLPPTPIESFMEDRGT
jgi:HEAT repeat protein